MVRRWSTLTYLGGRADGRVNEEDEGLRTNQAAG